TPGTAAPLISPRTDPAPAGGGGGAPQARVGWGMPARYTGILLRRRGRGRPVEAYGYPLAKAQAG
ncbi:hypothetical protein, partial [Methanoculleus sp.]|uniref:hypothetical protein n=1 Tax=Methanoculleus sp. TaxID=90427 RepID=UPI002B674FAA